MWTDFQNFFHQEICKKILYVYYNKDFHLTCNMLLHYLVKLENPKKCYQIFMLNVTVNMFN